MNALVPERDGSEPFHHLVTAHADAIVLNRQKTVIAVEPKRDARLRIIVQECGIGDGLAAQPLACIGRV
jgi:hypothetical protein